MKSTSSKQTKSRRPQPLRLTISAGGAPSAREHGTFLARHLKQAHTMLKPPLRELSVALVGDARMAELHERFMNIAGPTDVLTFPLDVDEQERVTSGEVVVCVPEARRRAREQGVALRNEVLLYALHGMLHLCGHDDRTATGYRRMHQTEDRILTALGIGPTFVPATGGKTGGGSRPGALPATRPVTRRGAGRSIRKRSRA